LVVLRVRESGRQPFASELPWKYQRRSGTIDETFLRLFIQGLAMRNLQVALRLPSSGAAPLSPSANSRLRRQFRSAYAAFDRPDLSVRKFGCVWVDGICPRAGPSTKQPRLMVLNRAACDGKESDACFQMIRGFRGRYSIRAPRAVSMCPKGC
jgi:hypothetical protein